MASSVIHERSDPEAPSRQDAINKDSGLSRTIFNVIDFVSVGRPRHMLERLWHAEYNKGFDILGQALEGSYRTDTIAAGLVATAAAALSGVTEHEASRIVLLVCLAFSLACIASSIFYLSPTCIVKVSDLRDEWNKHGPRLVISLSLSGTWLLYAITTFKVALLIEAWRGHVLAVKIVLTVIIGLVYLLNYYIAVAFTKSDNNKMSKLPLRPARDTTIQLSS